MVPGVVCKNKGWLKHIVEEKSLNSAGLAETFPLSGYLFCLLKLIWESRKECMLESLGDLTIAP
jgi:hypothetical protein